MVTALSRHCVTSSDYLLRTWIWTVDFEKFWFANFLVRNVVNNKISWSNEFEFQNRTYHKVDDTIDISEIQTLTNFVGVLFFAGIFLSSPTFMAS